MKRIFLLAISFVLPITAYTAPPKTSSQDRSWLVAAHQNNLAEIQSGNLAAQSGHSEAVRSAGQWRPMRNSSTRTGQNRR